MNRIISPGLQDLYQLSIREGKPLTLYLPERYEANYAYPLIIWFHDQGSDEDQLLDIMPDISDQNFIGLGFRGNKQVDSELSWSSSQTDHLNFIDELHSTLREVRNELRIHEDRVYLAGFRAGGTYALQLFLNQPDSFAGVVSINSEFDKVQHPFSHFRMLTGQRALMIDTNGIDGQQVNFSSNQTVKAGRLLQSAGVNTTMEIYNTYPGLNSQLLRRVNEWVMKDIVSAC